MSKKIQGKLDILVNQKNTEEASRLFDCDKIELVENHIMIWRKEKLLYKVWLNYNKFEKYKNLKEAMKDVGMSLYESK